MIHQFTNPGLVDLVALTTLGVNVKPAAGGSPIGHFGTGAAFAIATVLRGGGSVRLRRGDETSGAPVEYWAFLSVTETIRGEDFGLVYLAQATTGGTARPLGFTTALGRGWEPWMAYREFWSNARDEAGSQGPGTTVFSVEWDAWDDLVLGDFLLAERGLAPIATALGLEVYPGPGTAVFYRGIKVGTSPKASLYTYNITSQQTLTEDRTLPDWRALSAIQDALPGITDPVVAQAVLLAEPLTWEQGFDFNNFGPKPSAEWRAAVLAADRHKVNLSARRGLRVHYSEDFLPTPVWATAEQLAVISGFPWDRLGLVPGDLPWTSVLIARLEAGGYHLENEVLYLPSELQGLDLAERLLHAWESNLHWNAKSLERRVVEGFFPDLVPVEAPTEASAQTEELPF